MTDTPIPTLIDRSIVHEGWSSFSIARFRLADGTVVNREIEDHGRAVGVLPYDPGRKVAVLISQFRPAVLLAGGGEAPILEVPAGLLDEDDPAEGARREALEEAGLRLSDLELVVSGWSMPGISTERMDCYLAAFSEADRVTAGGGLAEEHEDIRVLEFPLKDLERMALAGEIKDVKTLLLAFALRLRHPELFA